MGRANQGYFTRLFFISCPFGEAEGARVRQDSEGRNSGENSWSLSTSYESKNIKFGLVSCEALFGPCETVARTLQSEKASAKGALGCVTTLRQRMHALRDDGIVREMTAKVKACAERNNLQMPLPP